MPDLEKLMDIGYDSPDSHKSLTRRIYDFGSKYIDLEMGLIGAGVMGGFVFGINYCGTHDLFGSTTAALKQGSYTFLFGGAVMKGCEYLATRIYNKTIARVASVIIPSIITIGLTYGIHNLKGTPKPIGSTVPTAVTVIPATIIWGGRKRKSLDLTKTDSF